MFDGTCRYAGRTGSLAEYQCLAAPLTGAARARNTARQLVELPWFARNVLFKLLVTARAEPSATGWAYRATCTGRTERAGVFGGISCPDTTLGT